MDKRKHFGVDLINPEAQAEEISRFEQEIIKLEVEIDTLELLSDYPNPEGSPQMHKLVEQYNQVVNRFYEGIDQIHSLGCYLKDVDLGLIDFYSMYQGRMVYLCWTLGESKIDGWHEIGRGFIDRQPLLLDKDQPRPSD